jgi:hypothetical protein
MVCDGEEVKKKKRVCKMWTLKIFEKKELSDILRKECYAKVFSNTFVNLNWRADW